MRKPWLGRKGVSTMIGGIIILTLFLTALTAMVLLSQQYDAYQTILNAMSQKDVDRYSENLAVTYPGVSGPRSVSGCGGTCNQYNLTISNLSGLGTQVARIYINNSAVFYGIYVLDPATTPSSYRFQSYNSFINQGEAAHQVLFWLPSSLTLPTNYANAVTFTLVTTRGRVFSFQWPFPPAGTSVPTGSTVDMGPFRISIDYNLITYTTNTRTLPSSPPGCENASPSPTPCIPGGWTFASGVGIVFYVRIINLGSASIILSDTSALIAHQINPAAAVADVPFYIARPMSPTCHDTYFLASYLDGSWSSIPGGCPTPATLAAYNATYPTPICSVGNPCYNIPQGPALGQPGQEEYVLFAANAKGTTTANSLGGPGFRYEVTLALFYTYQGYGYSMTLPLLNIAT